MPGSYLFISVCCIHKYLTPRKYLPTRQQPILLTCNLIAGIQLTLHTTLVVVTCSITVDKGPRKLNHSKWRCVGGVRLRNIHSTSKCSVDELYRILNIANNNMNNTNDTDNDSHNQLIIALAFVLTTATTAETLTILVPYHVP